MSDHHRSSYYKDSYGSSSSKRYHSPSEASRMNVSSGDYYDSAESRSKRSRTDNYGAHTTTSRYSDYSASSSTSGSRYKATSSSSYYDLPGYKPSASSSTSSSKYLDDYKGSGSSSRSAPKNSSMRRIPPPLTPPSLSSKSSSSIRLQPLMKVSLSTSSSGVGSGSSKDYYGSRMRQAPPEHHYSYSGSHSSSSYSKTDFKRPLSYSSSKNVSSSSYHSTARQSSTVPYRSNTTVASRRLLARSRAPPPSGVASRNRGRSTMMNSRRDIRSRKVMPVKHGYKRSRSRSRSDDKGVKTGTKDKKDESETESKSSEKKQPEDEAMDYVNIADGQVVVEEVAGDDDDDADQEENGHHGDSKEQQDKSEDGPKDDQSVKSNTDDLKSEQKCDKHEEKSGTVEKPTEDQGKSPTTRALLKLHCPYCDVRCISFREFTFHLRSNGHTRTMHGAVTDMKKKLMKVRQEMKEDQRKREKAEKVLSDTSSYCRVCELSFRTDPKEHEANEIHNKIKTLIYRRCDVCDIDFRIWKVHIYHMAALEHAKRVAMKELQEGDAKGDNVKGTNLSPEELGLDLVEIRTVFYCNACIRYIPIKGEEDEAKRNHCMTLNHLKSVEEFNERERRRAQREEARERAKRRKQEETEKDEKAKDDGTASGEVEKTVDGNTEIETTDVADDKRTTVQVKQEPVDTDEKNVTDTSGNQANVEETDTKEPGDNVPNKEQHTNRNEAEEDDDDEIELHAGEDDVEDESEDTGDWSRRTRSSQRGDGSAN